MLAVGLSRVPVTRWWHLPSVGFCQMVSLHPLSGMCGFVVSSIDKAEVKVRQCPALGACGGVKAAGGIKVDNKGVCVSHRE